MHAEDSEDIELKIEEVKTIVAQKEPPVEKCYPDKPMGKSGNRVVHKLCTFCDYKNRCWADANDGKGLIEYDYSREKVYFTELVRAPNNKEQEEDESN